MLLPFPKQLQHSSSTQPHNLNIGSSIGSSILAAFSHHMPRGMVTETVNPAISYVCRCLVDLLDSAAEGGGAAQLTKAQARGDDVWGDVGSIYRGSHMSFYCPLCNYMHK